MGYVEDNLAPNEKIFFTAHIHPAVFLPAIIVLFFAFVPVFFKGAYGSQMLCFSGFLFLYALLLGLRAMIAMYTTEFAVTNRRVIAKRGFIRRHTLEILLAKVESVSVRQDMLGRLLDFGTVTVTGTGGTKESFAAIVDPIEVRKKINQILESYVQYQQKLYSRQASV